MKEVFRVRTCKERRLAPRSRPCLEFQLEHCLGPCAGMVSAADYGQAVQEAVLFLKGKSRRLLKKLKAEMERGRGQSGLRAGRDAAGPHPRHHQHLGAPGHGPAQLPGSGRPGTGPGQRPGPDPGAVGAGRPGHRQPGVFLSRNCPRTTICWGPSSSSTMPRDGPLPDEMLLPQEIRRPAAAGGPAQRRERRAAAPVGAPGGRAAAAPGPGRRERPGRPEAPPDPAGTGRGPAGPERKAEFAPTARSSGMPGHLHPAGRAAGGLAGGLREWRPGQIRLPAFPHQRGGRPGRLRHAPGSDPAPLRQGGPGPAGPAGGGRRPGAVKRGPGGPERGWA